MLKYKLFTEYNNIAILGEDFSDALLRQKTLTTQKITRRVDLGIPGETYDGPGDRYTFEETGGKELRIKRVIEIQYPENTTRGDKPYQRAICELEDGKIIEVDAVEEYIGRPTLYGEKMRQTALYLPEEMMTWLKSQPGTVSETIRTLVEKVMS